MDANGYWTFRRFLGTLVSMIVVLVTAISAEAYTLKIQNTGLGDGNINGTVTCTLGMHDSCLSTLPDGSSVSLTAAAFWSSVFDHWGTPCSGNGSCEFTLSEDTTLDAIFILNLQAGLFGMGVTPEYSTLNDAYDAAIAGQVVFAYKDYTFYENLSLNRGINVTLSLGRDPSDYWKTIGETTMNGTLDINGDTAIVKAMIVSELIVRQGSIQIESLVIQ